MKRALAFLLSLSIIGLSSGLAPYAALAGVVGQVGSVSGSVAPGQTGAAGAALNRTGSPESLSIPVVLRTGSSFTGIRTLRPEASVRAPSALLSLPDGTIAPAIFHSARPPASKYGGAPAPRTQGRSLPLPGLPGTGSPVRTPLRHAAGRMRALGRGTEKAGAEEGPAPAAGVEPHAERGGLRLLRAWFDGSKTRRGAVDDASAVRGRSFGPSKVLLDRTRDITPEQARAEVLAENVPWFSHQDGGGVRLSSLEGTVDLAQYRVPGRIVRVRKASLAAHAVLLGAALAVLVAAAGPVPAAFGAGLTAAKAVWTGNIFQPDDGAHAFNSMMYGQQKKDYRSFLDGLLKSLVRRTGTDERRAPRLNVANGPGAGAYRASSLGTDWDGLPLASITMGEGFANEPATQTAGVLGHELGHIYHGDFTRLREFRNRYGLRYVMGRFRDLAFFSALAAALMTFFGPTEALLWGGAGLAGLLLVTRAAWRQRKVLAWTWRALDRLYERAFRMLPYGGKKRRSYETAFRSAYAAAAGLLVFCALGGAFVWTPPLAPALGAALLLSALPLAWLGMVAGIAVSKQDELRADHFAAWLTDPWWLAQHFDMMEWHQAEDLSDVRETLRFRILYAWWLLHSDHPSNITRIRRLRGYKRDPGFQPETK